MMMKSLKEKLEAGVPASRAALRIVDLEPALSHIEKEVSSAALAFPSAPDLPAVLQLFFSTLLEGGPGHNDPSPKVEDLAKLLANQAKQCNHGAVYESDVLMSQQLTVAALGCITFLFSRKHTPDMENFSVHVGSPLAELAKVTAHMDDCGRRFGNFIRPFGLLPTPYKYDDPPRPDNVLHLSLLNVHSLVRIGRLEVEWVPHISQHLVLDVHARTLRLFQFPSICVLGLAGGNYQKLSTRLMNGLYDTATFNLHREVLLSLRFILGGTRLSRRLARKSLLLSPAEGGDSAFGHLFAGRLDHLLTASTNGNMSRQVAQQDFLTPWGEFPLLCNRLLEIQEYNKGQRPTKTRAQIRDLRNPAQWCTLWAVMIIGCAGLFLSALQLGIGVAQLKYAIKPNSDPPQTTPAAAASSTTGLGAPNS